MPKLTTTSYAVLGLLNIQPWSAYDLTRQATRSLRYAWPVSESKLYSEPKRLVAAGLAEVTQEAAGPSRTKSVYRITDEGCRELARWLETDPAPPRLEFESMLRLLYADAAGKEHLLRALDLAVRQAEDVLADGIEILRGYAAGEAPFPERLHISVLVGLFNRDLLTLVQRWSTFARNEVENWPITTELGLTESTRRILEQLVADERVLPEANGRRGPAPPAEPAGQPL